MMPWLRWLRRLIGLPAIDPSKALYDREMARREAAMRRELARIREWKEGHRGT